mmetsp:Transcript_77014/g.214149  ORF Transcript_77014/g.214149 Transcript_77014/m.214149 type:complete len:533 (+) Transcript_77014:122-1720(+)
MADPGLSKLYGQLSAEQQAEFSKTVIGKLQKLIGGYGELTVLAEYIAVMLQSQRPFVQIQTELEAFLQEQSMPFTEWLFRRLKEIVREGSAAKAKQALREGDSEALLCRVVQDARQGTAVEPENDVPRRKKRTGEHKSRRTKHDGHGSAPTDASRGGGVAASDNAPTQSSRRQGGAEEGRGREAGGAGAEEHRSRSRQRQRRRQRRSDATNGGGSPAKRPTSDRKAILTPNVQSSRDPYAKVAADVANDAEAVGAPPPDTRWHFRADITSAMPEADRQPPLAGYGPPPGYGDPASVYGSPPSHHGVPAHHPHDAHGLDTNGRGLPAPGATDMPPGYHGGSQPPLAYQQQPMPASTRSPRGAQFQIKKWRVARNNTVVRATEALDSAEVQLLKEGEIVEQVSPPFKMKSGIIRIQIRHPSSTQFPLPIGWVTQDATAAGGPKFLEQGPEAIPVVRPSWRPPQSTAAPWASTSPTGNSQWRHKGSADGPPTPRVPAPPRGQYGFQNLCWTASGSEAANAKPAAAAAEGTTPAAA